MSSCRGKLSTTFHNFHCSVKKLPRVCICIPRKFCPSNLAIRSCAPRLLAAGPAVHGAARRWQRGTTCRELCIVPCVWVGAVWRGGALLSTWRAPPGTSYPPQHPPPTLRMFAGALLWWCYVVSGCEAGWRNIVPALLSTSSATAPRCEWVGVTTTPNPPRPQQTPRGNKEQTKHRVVSKPEIS